MTKRLKATKENEMFSRLFSIVGHAELIADVGTGSGEEIRRFRRHWPDVHIVGVDACEKWIAGLRLLGVECHPVAIAAHVGETIWFESQGRFDMSSSIHPPTAYHDQCFPGVVYAPPVVVACTTLDAIMAGRAPDLVWADLQGAEGDLILGGRQTFTRSRFLYTEYSDIAWYQGQWSLERILNELKTYKIEFVHNFNVLLRNEAAI